VTAQPRYAIFYEVKSFIFMTTRSAVQGIFCSSCAEKKALSATAVTWLLGWWGFPWGLIYSIQAIFNNLVGGQRPASINARLAAHQAWVFAVLKRLDLARALALDALDLSKNLGVEATRMREQLQKLLAEIGGEGGNISRLKDPWALLRRPFYVQGMAILAVVGFIWYGVQSGPTRAPPRGPKPYMASSQGTPSPKPAYPPPKPAYVRPSTAPNGEGWPLQADYVDGYPRINDDGLSQVTIDNSQNDSDVFVKVVSLDGPNALPVRTLFIPSHERFTVATLTAGSYDVRYRDLKTGRLSRSEPFSLVEVPTYNGTRYSDVTMTLYKVRNGNLQTYDLSETEF
jgi:hypothetical protein